MRRPRRILKRQQRGEGARVYAAGYLTAEEANALVRNIRIWLFS